MRINVSPKLANDRTAKTLNGGGGCWTHSNAHPKYSSSRNEALLVFISNFSQMESFKKRSFVLAPFLDEDEICLINNEILRLSFGFEK